MNAAQPSHVGPASPLSGIRVVELGRFASAPSCATLLADWGADVVKLEPPSGDPARGPGSIPGVAGPVNPRFDVHNRSRRSIALDLGRPEEREAALRLIGSADVFVTNLRPGSLERLGLTAATLRAEHPRLVYGHVTGYGQDTSLAEDRSFDHGAFWSYAGVASMFATADGEPPQPAGGFGDRAAGSILAGAICAALLAAARTGEGAYVTTSLVTTGLWLMASDVADALATPGHARSTRRRGAPIPTLNAFRTSDGRWLWLQVMLPEADRAALVGALGAPWLADRPLTGSDPEARAELVDALDEIFARRPLAEWAERLRAHGLTWAPVRTLREVVDDAEVRESSAFLDVADRSGTTHRTVNSPCVFDGAAGRAATSAPDVGEHTPVLLAELGLTLIPVADDGSAGQE